MPIYEYECNACGERHEFIQKFSDAPKRKCPDCGKSRLRKLVSAAAFHLKGNGWYVTDFRDKEKKGGKDDKSADKSASTDGQSDNKSDNKSSATSESGSGSTAESKSEARREPKADRKAATRKGDSSATPAP